MLTARSPEIVEALVAWHEAGRASFESRGNTFSYDEFYPKTANGGRRWIKLDRNGSGVFMVDAQTSEVWNIKGYGVPRRKVADKLADMVAMWRLSALEPDKHGSAYELSTMGPLGS